MKTNTSFQKKRYGGVLIATAVIAFAILNITTSCKKDEPETKTVTVTVRDTVKIIDTLKGKSISGLCTYPNYTNVQTPAAGAVISLYMGTTKTGTPVLTTFADASGKYVLPYLLPNNYFIFATYNTKNKNFRVMGPNEGVNFETNPGNAVVMAKTDLTQNLTLATVAAAGTLKIGATATDTTTGTPDTTRIPGSRMAPFESHSKCTWWTEYSAVGDGGKGGTTLEGGFNTFKVTEFYFDEANPANSYIKGYVLLSSINTMEPARDALSGCVPQTLQLDTLKVGVGTTATYSVLVKEADTAWYTVPAGKIEKYGKGYLAHGTLMAFYKHQGGNIIPPRITPLPPDTVSWNGKGPQYAGPWNQRISNPVDMYFEYQGKNKIVGTTAFNWFFIFEGEFTFTRQQYYFKTSSIANVIHVTAHVQLKGKNNVEY